MQIPLGTIDLSTGEVEVINTAEFVCQATGRCCKQFTIPVTEEEVGRIEEHGYDIQQFIEDMTPALLPNKTGRGLVKIYFLRKKPFTTECVFLDGVKCKIHEFKPLACRLYPFQYELDDGKMQVGIHPQNTCDNVSVSMGATARGERVIREVYETVTRELVEGGIERSYEQLETHHSPYS